MLGDMGPFRVLVTLLVLAAAARAGNTSLEYSIDSYLAEQPRLPDEPLLASSSFGGLTGWFAARLSAWYPKIDGTVASQGEMVDVGQELGLDDRELAPLGRLDFRFLGVGIRLDAYHVSYSGNGQINRTFTFQGATFQIGEPVSTDLEITQGRFMFLLPLVDTTPFMIALEGGVSIFHLQGTITGNTAGRANGEATVPLPAFGVLMQSKLGPVLMELDVLGFSLIYDGNGGKYIDISASVGISIFKFGSAHIGYRHVIFDGGSRDDVQVDVTLSGFFIGIGVQF